MTIQVIESVCQVLETHFKVYLVDLLLKVKLFKKTFTSPHKFK